MAAVVAMFLWVGAGSAAASTTPGQLIGFGDNYFGELAKPADSDDPNPPTIVDLPAASGRVLDAATGGDFSLVVTSSGKVYAFGDNYYGQLGNTTNNDVYTANPTPVRVVLPGLKGHVVEVAAGEYHSLVLTSAGQIYAFGSNEYDQVGNAPNAYINPTPAQITLPGATGKPVRIAAGQWSSFAITSTGQLYAWGDNADGQLGIGSTNNTPTPTRVSMPGSVNVAAVSSGDEHTLALARNGALYGFGDNEYGQLGDADTGMFPSPTRVTMPQASDRVVQASAGDFASYVLLSTGTVYAFGKNYEGQLCDKVGLRTNNPNPAFQAVPLSRVGGRVVRLEGGEQDVMLLSAAGRLYGCGTAYTDAFGAPPPGPNNYYYPRPVAAQIAPGVTLDALAAGCSTFHGFAIVADLAIATRSLKSGKVGKGYRSTIEATGGTAPYTWSASGLPKGLAIGGRTGKLHGDPTKAGSYEVTLTVSDADGIVASRTLRLMISS